MGQSTSIATPDASSLWQANLTQTTDILATVLILINQSLTVPYLCCKSTAIGLVTLALIWEISFSQPHFESAG